MKSLKLGTFNVLNLALPEVTFYERERYTAQEYDKKRSWISSQLGRMGADVVGFQEVWQERALRDAAGHLYPHVSAPGASSEGPSLTEGPFVGIASRHPLVSCDSITRFPPGLDKAVEGLALPVRDFSRPVLRAKIALPEGRTMTFFVVHLKSKRPIVDPQSPRDDPYEEVLGKARALIVRASEAAALRFLVLEATAGSSEPVVVVGDLNDGVSAVTTEMITGSEPFHLWEKERKQPIWDRLLYSAWELHAERAIKDVSFTHIYSGKYENLDHILLSQEFVRTNPHRQGELVDLRYFNDHLLDVQLTDDKPRRTESDHGQLVAEIRWR